MPKYPRQLLEDRDWCNGKPCYDKKAALTARNKRWKEDREELRIYHCPDCNFWHLTSSLDGKRYGKFKNKYE